MAWRPGAGGGDGDIRLISTTLQSTNGPQSLFLQYEEALDPESVPAPEDFSLSDGRTVTGVSIDDDTVIVRYTPAFSDTDTATFTYTPGSNPISRLRKVEASNVSNRAASIVVSVFGPAQATFSEGGDPLPFTLEETARIGLGVVFQRVLNAQDVVYTVRDSNNDVAYETIVQFRTTNYENLAANQIAVENTVTTELPAGSYTYDAEIVGAGAPLGLIARRADAITGLVIQGGNNFHSGPYLIREGQNDIVAACEMGENTRAVKRTGEPPVFVLAEAALDTQERYHSATTIESFGGRYIAVGTDHNSELWGNSAPTLAGLSGAATRLGDLSSAYTYSRISPNADDTKLYVFSRSGTGGSNQGLHLLTVDPTNLATDRVDYFMSGGLKYPVELKRLSGTLFFLHWQQRFDASQRWAEPGAAIYDSSVGANGEFYNLQGDIITSGTGDTGGSPRLSAATLNQDYQASGASLLPELDGKYIYMAGPPAIRIGEWNGTKRAEAAFIFNTWDAENATAKEFTYVGLCVINGSNKVVVGGGLTDDNPFPFGLEPSNGYRGPSVCWWDGNDLIVVYAYRGERDRKYFYDTNESTNLYYDFTGDTLRAYRVTNALTHTTSADLANAITQIDEFTVADLSGGVDPQGLTLQLFGFQHITGNEMALQVDKNQLDVTQSQAEIRTITIGQSSLPYQMQGPILPTSKPDGYLFKLSVQQAAHPVAFVPGIYQYNSGTSTWSYTEGMPPAPQPYGGVATFNGRDHMVKASPTFPGFDSAFSLKATINGQIQGGNRILSWGQTASDDTIVDVGVEDSTGKIRLFWRNDARVQQLTALSNVVVLDGSDHTIEVTYSGTPGTNSVSITIDGSLDSTHDFSPSGSYTPDNFAIGALARNTIIGYFAGTIADVEIRENGVLTHAYPLDDAVGLVARDTAGNADGIVNALRTFWGS